MSTDSPQRGQNNRERQGGVRIDTELWVRVVGRDNEAVLRSGNICGSGFFFEIRDWPGRPGDIAVMEVSSEDLACSFTTMASLARVVNVSEARWSSAEPGVSYQFLPSDEATRTAIARTVRYIAEQHPEQAGDLVFEDFRQAASDGSYPGAVEDAMPCLESGAKVRLVVDGQAGGSKREVTGVVGDITESIQADGATRFWVPVYLVEAADSEQSRAPSESASPAQATAADRTEPVTSAELREEAKGAESLIDSMWKELVPEARSIATPSRPGGSPAGSAHLSGKLSQISMPSALWLLEQERLSGALEFRSEREKIVLLLREGRVIDAESPDRERDPRGHLAALLTWEEGEFRFRAEVVERPDRIGVATQGLLLELVAASDEAAKE